MTLIPLSTFEHGGLNVTSAMLKMCENRICTYTQAISICAVQVRMMDGLKLDFVRGADKVSFQVILMAHP